MAAGRNPPQHCMKKYSFPLFCSSWASRIIVEAQEEEGKHDDNDNSANNGDNNTCEGYLILGGGGGDGRTGVKNALVLAHYDFQTNVLSESVDNYYTNDDPPYRMTVHPVEETIVCSFSNGCRGFELRVQDASAAGNVRIHPSEKALNQLENVGRLRSLVFSVDGTLLAAGGDDGHLRVFEWPSLKILLNQPEAHKSIKDLDFSPDGTFLASLGDSGPCRIWNLSTFSPEASISVNKGERFGFCRFSRDAGKPFLFMTVVQGGKGAIAYWDTKTWEIVGTQAFEKNPISAFNISSDGRFLAIGSNEGDISIIEVSKMKLYQKVRGAHIIFVTSVEFSHDSSVLVSVSGDSSARVTKIEEQNQNAGSLLFWLIAIILPIILAFVAYRCYHY